MASVFFVWNAPYNDRTTEMERKLFIDHYCSNLQLVFMRSTLCVSGTVGTTQDIPQSLKFVVFIGNMKM